MAGAVSRRWSRVCIGDNCFVYGPRLGALYLLPLGQNPDDLIFRILGLHSSRFTDELTDPAQNILHDLTGIKDVHLPPVKAAWCYVYRFIHWSRNVIPFAFMLKGMTLLSRTKKHTRSISEIGLMLHAIEVKNGSRDCYPRAVITAYLCSQSKIPWEVTIGILSPTRMMHAWCSSNGTLPYEPLPEHYMYQPLIVFSGS